MILHWELPDGSRRSGEYGVTGQELALGIGPGLARAAVAVELDGALLDLTRPLPGSGRLRIITDRTERGREVLRHSAAHVLAQAVLDLYPGSTFAIGPPIEDGFYYDFGIDRPFSPEDLSRVEERMAEIIAADQPFVRRSISRTEASEIFRSHPFKLEIIESVDPSEMAEGRGGDRLFQQRVRRSVSRSSPAFHGAAQSSETAAVLGRLLEGKREQPAIAENLRYGVGVPPGAQGLSSPAGGGREA